MRPASSGEQTTPSSPGESCVFGIVDDHILKRGVNADFFLHALLAGGGELRDSDEERARTIHAGESLKAQRSSWRAYLRRGG